MRYIKLTVAYDGTNYVGWQVQPNGIAVQQRLEEAWNGVTQENIRVLASGRTDAGVHALGQVCSLKTDSTLDCRTLGRALNAHLPQDISVSDVQNAQTDFHAIRDASRKTYLYHIQYGPVRNPIGQQYRWYCPYDLDVEAMRRGASQLIGEFDFASFQAAGSERESTVRNMTRLECTEEDENDFRYIKIALTSNGFLYNMVRNIVGTLVKVGQGKQSVDWVGEVLLKKDRSFAGPTAPALGLVLLNVEYDGISFSSE